jgi:hypothetical protein
MTQDVSTEALNAIDRLTDAADAFVEALQAVAQQETNHRGYWAGYIAQIKHVTEHGSWALQAAEGALIADPPSNFRERMDALFEAQQALEKASKITYQASVTFSRKDPA